MVLLSYHSVYGHTIQIVDEDYAFPFLRNADTPREPMRWDSGKLIQLLSSCRFVRITRRGIRCISAKDQAVAGWENSFYEPGSKLSTPTAGVTPQLPLSACMPHSNSLCMTSDGNRFFPTDTVYVAEASVNKCVNGQGRSLVAERRSNETAAISVTASSADQNVKHDDISLCDVMDTNMDIVYDPVNNRIFYTKLNDSAWLYTSISIFILVVVVLTAETVSQRNRSNISHNIIAWMILSFLSLLMLAHTDGRMHPLITVQDMAFMAISVTYVTICTIYWVSSVVVDYRASLTLAAARATLETTETTEPDYKHDSPGDHDQKPHQELHPKPHQEPHQEVEANQDTHPSTSDPKDPPHPENPEAVQASYVASQRDGINAMIGSVHLATTVLYGTTDNSYVGGVFFVFLFRCMQKLYDAHTNPDHWTSFSSTVLLIDVVYTTLIFIFGMIPHYTDLMDTVLYAAAQYVICDTVASTCVVYIAKKEDDAPETTRKNAESEHPIYGAPNAMAAPAALVQV
jgi:hypothetical protein